MEVKVLVVLAVLIALGCCDDLSGVRVDGNKFVNHANQTVKLMVRELCELYTFVLSGSSMQTYRTQRL